LTRTLRDGASLCENRRFNLCIGADGPEADGRREEVEERDTITCCARWGKGS